MRPWVVAAPAMCAAACLTAPEPGPAPGGADAGGADASGPVDPGPVRFRSIGTTDPPLAEVEVSLSADGRLATVPVDSAGQLVVGVAVDIDNVRSHVLAIAGGELLLEDPLPGGGHATISHAYASLVTWEDDRERDLVAEGVSEVAVVAEDQFLSQLCDIDGFTTDPDHRVVVRAADGRAHDGRAGTGVTIRSDGPACVRIQDHHVTVERLAFAGCGSMGSHAAIKAQSATDVVVDRVLVHDYASPEEVGAVASVGGGEVTVRNTIVHGGVTGVEVAEASSAVVENSTFWSLEGPAVWVESGGSGVVRNSIMLDTDGTFQAPTHDHNLVDFPLSGATPSDPAILFVSITSSPPDLHLAAGAVDAVGAGADLRSSFEHDVDGEPRGAAWDIGADQLTPGTTN